MNPYNVFPRLSVSLMLGGKQSQNMFRPPINVLTLRSLVVSIRTAMLFTEISAVCAYSACVYVLRLILATKSDHIPTQDLPVGLCDGNTLCSL
jgi:hypothetical protein